MALAFLCVAACATCAPLNPGYRANEFDFYFSDLNAKALVVQSGIDSPAIAVAQKHSVPVVELSPRRDAHAGIFSVRSQETPTPSRSGFAQAGDVALILHTSGTTSVPKMVPLTHSNILSSARNIVAALQLNENDRCLNMMPLFHIHGLVGALVASLMAGGSVVCTSGFDAEQFFPWLEEFRPTWYTAVPTMHQAILAEAASHRQEIASSRLRFIRSSSAALPVRVMAELEEVFQVPVVEAYGMTEAAHQIASNPLPPRERKSGSAGVAIGTEIAVIDEKGEFLSPGERGEIVLRGPSIISGYEGDSWTKKEAFTNHWFRTGDQGYLDSDGYLFLTGRLKEMINRGGEKIAPYEVEAMLMKHPAITQAVVFPLNHPTLGEDVAAAVVPKPNTSITESELQKFAALQLADFKIPRRVLFLEKIPKGSTGKIRRVGLAEKLGLTTAGPCEQTEWVAPRTLLEAKLAKIWAQVLRAERVGVNDNFFDLGGDSISAARIISRVRETTQVELSILGLFESSTVVGLAKRIEEADREDGRLSIPPMVAVSRDKDLPLSFAQERLWFLDQYEPNSSVYNTPSALRLRGFLNIGALEQSLNEIIRRHESLRTTFTMVGREPIQLIASPVEFSLAVVDLRGHSEGEREEEAQRLVAEEAHRPFDLANGPLFRSKLLRLTEDDHVLLLTMHHIVSDGWSMGVLHHELSALYEAYTNHQISPLPELPIQYADYAMWQREWLQGEVLDRQLSYWKKQLEGIPAALNLPTDRPRPAVARHWGARQFFVLSKGLTEQLKALSRKEGVTLFMTLLAAFKALLYQYTDQTDLVVGSPIAGRNRPEIDGLIGFFVNTLVLRSNVSGNPSFRELVWRVREACLGAYAHQELPYQKLVEALQPKRVGNRRSLAQVFFAFQNVSRPPLKIPGLAVIPVRTDVGSAKALLTLFMWEVQEGLAGSWNYAADLFNSATISGMMKRFQTLLNAVVADPERRLLDLPAFLEQSRSGLFEAFPWAGEESWHFENDTTAVLEQGEI
jgi:acyl-CoA synthetase (AMP-forming)/AMP-acid ligase II/acyl carrier protein